MGYPHPSHPKETVVLSKYFGDNGARSFDGWVKRGGYEGLKKALGMTPDAITAIGAGTDNPWHTNDRDPNGQLVPELAVQNRAVHITVQP